MSTRNELLNGADYEGFEAYCTTLRNQQKNNWRQSDPQSNLTLAQPGMVASDEDDEKLYHKLGIGGPVSGACQPSGSPEWDEILQARMSCDTTPVFDSVDLGENNVMTDSRVKVYLNNNQLNIADTTWTKVLVDSEEYDSGGNADVGNNKIVTPVLGFYLLIGSVYWSATVADKRYISAIYVNGAGVSYNVQHAAIVAALSCLTVTVAVIAAGINVELYCYHNAGAATPDVQSGQQHTYLIAHLLSI